MTTIIETSRAHRLSKGEAQAAVEELAQAYQQQLGVRYRWRGDVLHVEGSGTEGRITVEDAAVRVRIELGMALWPLKGQVRAVLEQQLEEHFG